MPERRLDRRLKTRVQEELDSVPLPTPSPAGARYNSQALAGWPARRATLRGVGVGFVAGAAAVAAGLVLLTGSAQPRVWLDSAAGSVRHLEENLVESRQGPAPSPLATPSPAPESRSVPSAPQNRAQLPSADDDRRDASTQSAELSHGGEGGRPSPAPESDDHHDGTAPVLVAPSPSDDKDSSGNGDANGGKPAGTRPVPSPSASDDRSGHL